MTDERWAGVDRYLEDLLVPTHPALEAAVAASAGAGLPSIAVAPNQGALLALLSRLMGARRILEIGTLGGYSAIWLARALPEDGRLVTLEVDAHHADVARTNLDRASVGHLVEIRLGAALDSLKTLVAERAEPFDLVFIDADKTGYTDYLDWSLRLSRPGTLIVADNVVRGGAVADPRSTDPMVLGVRRFLEHAGAHPRLMSTAIQTVGSKGYDGLSFSLVTE